MSTINKFLSLFVFIAVLAVGAGGYLVWQKYFKAPGPALNQPDNKVPDLSGNSDLKKPDNTMPNGEVKKDQVNKVPVPDLDRPINITVNLPQPTRDEAIATLQNIIRTLKADSASFGDWINLGLYRKLIGDYEGAKQAWQYAGVISPSNFRSFGNLGDLYTYAFKDYKKAEEYYLTSIKNAPDQIMIYEKLSELYRYFFKDDAKAKAALERGISANPMTSQRLKYLLDNY